MGADVLALLLRFPHVVLWVNGHTHRNEVIRTPPGANGTGFWEVNTAAHVDFPHQSRILEITDNLDGTWSIFGTIVDAAGPLALVAGVVRGSDGLPRAGRAGPRARRQRLAAARDQPARRRGRPQRRAARHGTLRPPRALERPTRTRRSASGATYVGCCDRRWMFCSSPTASMPANSDEPP